MERPPWKDPLVYLPPLLFALNLVASRTAMREIPPEWGSFLRFALAVPLFLLVLGRPPRLAPLGETLFLALSGVALFNLVFFTGVRLAPASDASAVAALYPLASTSASPWAQASLGAWSSRGWGWASSPWAMRVGEGTTPPWAGPS